jgi:hypothetical protein
MLTRILFLSRFFYFILLVTAFTNYSQYKIHPQVTGLTGTWSISYNAGIGLNTLGKAVQKISFETTYRETSSHEFVLSIAAAKLPERTHTRRSLFEVSIGPRLYPLKNKTFFAEAKLGMQLNSLQKEEYDWFLGEGYFYTSEIRAAFLLSVAAGIRLPVTENNSLLLRLGYNTTFPSEEGLSYFGALVGLDFQEGKDNKSKIANFSRFSISAGGGFNEPLFREGIRDSGKVSFSLEGIYSTGRLSEFYLAASYNRLHVSHHNTGFAGLNFGPRFYINKSTFSSFIELGGGVFYKIKESKPNNFYINEPDQDFDPLQPAINIGTGFTGRLSRLLSMYAKGNLNFFFTDDPDFPAFSTLTGGLRFNL